VFISSIVFVSCFWYTFRTPLQFWTAMVVLPPAMAYAEATSPHTVDTPMLMAVGGTLLWIISHIKLKWQYHTRARSQHELDRRHKPTPRTRIAPSNWLRSESQLLALAHCQITLFKHYSASSSYSIQHFIFLWFKQSAQRAARTIQQAPR